MTKRLIISLILVAAISLTLVLSVEAGSYGPKGGTGGSPFSYTSPSGSFSYIVVGSGRRIDSLWFVDANGTSSLRYGGRGGSLRTIPVNRQCITKIRISTGIAKHKRHTESVFSLTFYFSNGYRTILFGRDGEKVTTLAAPLGEEIIGFFGRAGAEIDALGIITGPSRCS